ncbi:hypothetical protein Lesp02_72610 [Lentzea sp. NBRC 105346]|nr:hypothetical protein Lesp02_72610 [Lentzea sp. NBRC 105346]
MFVASAAVVLLPWTAYLGLTLPVRHEGQWRLAWVGFDLALVACFAGAAWLGAKRSRAAVGLLAATAALLGCDAWFDVVLSWGEPDSWISVLMAVCAELPIAALLAMHARTLLVGGMPSRELNGTDIKLHTELRPLTTALAEGPASTEELAAALDRPVADDLRALAAAGHVRKGRDGRWRFAPLDLRRPDVTAMGAEERLEYERYMDAKYDRELELLSWAAAHRDEFGPWAQGSRAGMNLTEAELARFDAEYGELVTRYCLLHPEPTAATRQLAVRWYAFPAELP